MASWTLANVGRFTFTAPTTPIITNGVFLHNEIMRRNLLFLFLLVAGCSKDPEVSVRELFSAVREVDVGLVRKELSRGVSPDYFDPGYGYLIQSAHFSNSTQMLELLIDAGANVNSRKEEGDGALLHAVVNDQCEHARLLLAAGGDVNERYRSFYRYAEKIEYKDKTVKEIYFMHKNGFFSYWKKNELCWVEFEKLMKVR